ncbi:hypothetical protein [Streptomyces nymphaeiformis]|uniref:Uncharacterized protein n=1 Tax=Streptomyces nymphaeiformis TaxID=2663842 RepID=A0A7W7U5U5_9ACTN|nr:hypothetical protein [Streptomyces nymphaeiformis]MBB4984135.1 hypothetical protein [Streptomyces nymphaeiformis]
MTFIAHVQTADEASELVADLVGGNVRDLDALAHHLGSVRLTLDLEHKEIWWAAPERDRWTVETTTPGQCLDLIRDRADPAWVLEPTARADYQSILAVLLPPVDVVGRQAPVSGCL